MSACRELLKYEFFLSPAGVFRERVRQEMDDRFDGWRQRIRRGESPFSSASLPLFAPAILRSVFEAYYNVSRHLKSIDDAALETGNKSVLLRSCLKSATKLRERDEIRSDAAVSLPLMESALKYADHEGAFDDDDAARISARLQFAERMRDMLTHLNRLQGDHDRLLEAH